MAMTSQDYIDAINKDLKAIPECYLPFITHLIRSFKQSVVYHMPLSEVDKALLDEVLEIILKEDLEDLKLLKATRAEQAVLFEDR